MTAKIDLPTQSLYDRDYDLWLWATAEQLRAGSFEEVDLENLIEEIESMGKERRNAIRSFLRLILEHLLKMAYWESEREYNLNHWAGENFNFRYQIKYRLEDSPSLKNYLIEIFDATYQEAAKKVKKEFKFNVPDQCPFTLEQVLDPDWFPIDLEEDDINQ
ncbi:MAG: hypothetical protein N5P05_001261 [Chroococcopsis gigantea SAG 12.99]|jgi:hypothetical protein|nr:DUF29 domain-containing protein [Chlorogloea purpurea SAG 13.99]MDV2999655.1 hypothetical protein [Chroococcopsis gigantea SAG 12.99]